MLRSLLVVVVLATAVCANPFVESIPQEVRQGYFLGRSDNVIISEPTVRTPRSHIAILDPSGLFIESDSLPSSMSILSVSDVVARSFGTVAPVDAHRNAARNLDLSFLKTGTFKRPHANVMFAVTGVSKDDISSVSAPNLAASFARAATLTDRSFPSDVVSASVSLATGAPASVHGVVSSSWTNPQGVRVNAFTDDSASHSQAATIADIVTQSFDSKSWSVSVSSNPQLAAAYCVHSNTRKARSVVAVCSSYDSKKRTFGDSQRSDWPTQTHAQIAADFATNTLWRAVNSNSEFSVQYHSNSALFELNVAGDITAFNMNQEADFALFAELQYMSNVVSTLESMNGLRDGVPDLFAFTIDTLAGVSKAYGSSSSHFKAAVRLVDAVVANLMARVSALYNDRVLSQIVLWGHTESHSTSEADLNQERAAVIAVLQRHSLSSIAEGLQWPVSSIHIPLKAHLSLAQLSVLCDDLAEAARFHSVHCPSVHMAQMSTLELASALSLSTVNHDTVTTTVTATTTYDPALYQIVLWFSIGSAFVLLVVIYSLCCMEFKRDTLLYSRFNPTVKSHSRA